ncbi:lipoprotein [Acuticoccus mangrovi]|uniref:Type IV secretion system putative lipoprotein virB7 n=1 Tax=Acuticoccus mangrovi TaxID=2796142 RepID=A0A934IL49_9HYPH|nr:lipoprotein [Acuticoccus mangrovi]MBJ3774351.1 membrane lipoprotein lipid attachment site-containing protein [Acuticoccus mangrovi]
MKKIILALSLVTALAACNSTNQQDRALVGGALGAATGATIAAVAGADAGGALAGAAVGAVGGAVLGAATTPSSRCVNQYGEPVPCP